MKGCVILDNDEQLIEEISKALVNEVKQYNFYNKLAELAPKEEYQHLIIKIQSDEIKHYQWLNKILPNLDGLLSSEPDEIISFEFEEGLSIAIQNELDSAICYLRLSSRALSTEGRLYFKNAALDEQRHLSQLQYILMNL